MSKQRSRAGSLTIWAALALATTAVACSTTPPPRFGSLQISERKFEVRNQLVMFEVTNGLVVALAPDDRTNLVSVDVRYQVGAGQDPAGRSGLAHLIEHLSFEAASGPGGATISDRLSSLALTFNAYTNHDVTHYTSTALAERLDALIDLEGQRMEARCDALDDKLYARERDVVLAEEAERRTPLSAVQQELAAEVWGAGHPYARAVNTREIATVTKAEACKFFDAHYVPAQAVMVVTGNFDPGPLQERIGRRFGPIRRTAPASAVRIGPALLDGDDSEHRADLDHPVALIYLAAPAWGADDEATHDMVMTALAGALDDLDREHDWVLDTGIGYTGDGRRRATVISIAVTDPAKLEAAIDAVLSKGRDLFEDDDHDGHAGDIDDADDRAMLRRIGALRGVLQTQTVTRFDAIGGRGDWLADYLTYTTHHEFALARMRAIDAVTAQALVTHAHTLFDRKAAHIVRILPTGAKTEAATAIITAGARTYDLVPWRAEVDPGEAARPLGLPRQSAIPIGDETLANGLRVLTYPEPSSPIVDARLVYPVGAVDDAPGAAGVAALAGYLLDHDVERTYPNDVVRKLNWAFGIGTVVREDVDDSATVFSTRGLAAFSDWHLWRLSWLLDQGVYPAQSLRAARQNLREGGDEEVSPSGVAFREALFGRAHPYAQPPATVAQLAAISRGQLTAWQHDHFVPEGATLIVTGGFDREQMPRIIRELFGAWPKRAAAARAPVPAPHPTPGPTWMGVRIPTSTRVTLYVGFATRSRGRADRAARLVLIEMITDRLRIVREGLGASYNVAAGYGGGAAGTALFIKTALDPARAPEAAAAAMLELTALQLDAAQQTEAFARARRRVLTGLLASSRDAESVADELELLARGGGGVEQLQELTAQVANLTPADVAAVASADLAQTRMTVSVDGPAAPAAATLTALGANDPTWFDE